MKIFTNEGLRVATGVTTEHKVLTHKGRLMEVQEVEEVEIENPIRIRLKRFDFTILPADLQVYIYNREIDEHFEWKKVSRLEKKHRMVVPIVDKYMRSLDDTFWSSMRKHGAEKALDIVREVQNIDLDFINYIRENNPTLDVVQDKYGMDKTDEYDDFITVSDDVVRISTRAGRELDKIVSLKVKKDNSFVTTCGTLKGKD